MVKYQKIKIRKAKTKLLSTLAIACIVLVAASTFFIYTGRQKDHNSTESPTAQTNNEQNGTADNQDPTETSSKFDNDQTADSSTSNNNAAVDESPNANLTITELSQSGGQVRVTAELIAYQTELCNFKFVAEDGSVINKEAKVEAGACSLSLSELEFTYLGAWNVTIAAGNHSDQKGINIK